MVIRIFKMIMQNLILYNGKNIIKEFMDSIQLFLVILLILIITIILIYKLNFNNY